MRTSTDLAQLAERELGELAPDLLPGFRAALPRAVDTVGRRLRGALHRERLVVARPGPGDRAHAFDRVEFAGAPALSALLGHVSDPGVPGLAAELTDAVVNLAIAYARPRQAGGPAPDDRLVWYERLATEGHNLHPCGRTRLGWHTADVLAHDLETPGTGVGFIGVHHSRHVGDDLGAALRAEHPGVPTAPPGYVVQPVHAWQLRLLAERYRDLMAAGVLLPLDAPELPVLPTAALRTVLLPAGACGNRQYLKLSLDIQVTSTRRTISVASTRNGPVISVLLHRLLADDPDGSRIVLLDEVAGAALDAGAGRNRDAAAILRTGLAGLVEPGEQAVPGVALPATDPRTGRPVLAGLVDAYAATRGYADPAVAAGGFLDEYAGLLLPVVLRLATRYGVGLEAHLQNCVPTFRDGVPRRMILRDFAGLRLHLPRLRARAAAPPLWPGSVVATDDVDVLRAKVAYTALQAHLGELVVVLAGTHGLDEPGAWRRIRERVDDVYGPLRADPAIRAAAAADHAFLTAPRVLHKALVRMRLAGSGDVYVPVANPLHG
ncbi:MAG TPA: IucA/IucC family protein [Micromonosporaceae bacterium]|nr:IucA/IucC family protein [Micromonosporaceae bacterium]